MPLLNKISKIMTFEFLYTFKVNDFITVKAIIIKSIQIFMRTYKLHANIKSRLLIGY